MNYVYVCDSCKIKYEKQHGMKEKPIFKCEECKKKLKQVISGGVGTIYRGGGWTKSGTKDPDYDRKSTLDGFRRNPDNDPYKMYRNWSEEHV